MTEHISFTENGVFYDNAVQSVTELADTIRRSSTDQVGYWQQLPLFGLLSWGNHGAYLTEDQWLFEQGVIGVDATNSAHELLGTYVDCESGEIIHIPYNGFDNRRPANDKQVIAAWLSHPKHRGFDGYDTLRHRKQRATKQFPPSSKVSGITITLESHLEVLTPRRLAIAQALGLQAIYRRGSSLVGNELDPQTHETITAVDPSFAYS